MAGRLLTAAIVASQLARERRITACLVFAHGRSLEE
jgi:hypothetical protein